jgi:protein SCO1
MKTRRQWLLAVCTLLFGQVAFSKELTQISNSAADAARSSHFPFGPVVPSRKMDAWPVTTHQGTTTDLPTLLRNKVTAVQFIFTRCKATCPIQGALFSQAQRELNGKVNGAQFLSISIDPTNDTPESLQLWLKKFGAGPHWLAVLPQTANLATIIERVGKDGEPRPPEPDPHTGQVFIFDRQSELVFRTPSMPQVSQIVEAIHLVDQRVPALDQKN